jgi:signal peptidase II
LTAVFAVLALVVVVLAIWWAARRVGRRSWAIVVGLGLAGALGNLIDRLVEPPGLLRGHVVDFIYLRHFATFNVADASLTTAAGLMILFVLRGVDYRPPAASAASPDVLVSPVSSVSATSPASPVSPDGPVASIDVVT